MSHLPSDPPIYITPHERDRKSSTTASSVQMIAATPPAQITTIYSTSRVKGFLIATAGLVCALTTSLLWQSSLPDQPTASPFASAGTGITSDAYLSGLRSCAAIRSAAASNSINTLQSSHPHHPRSRNPRSGLAGAEMAPSVLITNATLWNGDGSVQYNTDVLLKNSLVAQVAPTAEMAFVHLKSVTKINAAGRFVTPGLVDMHSHMGLDSWPELLAHSDTNEDSTTRVTPQLRSLDGFNPWDKAIKIINSGGVTTSLVLPGSRNLMGGEAFAFKHHFPKSNRTEDMLLNAGMTKEDGKSWRWMKMACGENPKNVNPLTSDGPLYPTTRMGEAYLFRERFAAATRAMEAQDDWCARADLAEKQFGQHKAHNSINGRFPLDLALESLIALLRGDVILNVHCYETYDLEMMVRLTHEFKFKISAFHHALEAWQVGDLLAKEKIAAAVFADHWGYKQEAYGSSVKAAQILSNKGVKVAFKSDHPVLNAQHLIFEAAKAHHYGLSGSLAIQAVTSVPAERMGQSHRIGYVARGYDADLVLWDRNPLEIGAHPLKVFVDGYETFEHTNFGKNAVSPLQKKTKADLEGSIEKKSWSCTIPAGTDKTYTLQNYTHVITSSDSLPSAQGDSMVVKDGIIACIGSCKAEGQVIDMEGFWITPGLVAAGVHLGLEEISAEDLTSSGSLEDSNTVSSQSPKDALQLGRHGSKELDAAFKAGVTTAVSGFRFKGLAGSDNVVFRTGGSDPVDDIIKTDFEVFNLAVGRHAMGSKGLQSNVAGHLQSVKNFKANFSGDTFGAAIKVHDAHNIRRIVQIMGDKDILVGAAEAWKHANKLSGKSVLLLPARCTPSTWGTRECIEPSRVSSSYSIFRNNSVNVCLSIPEDNFSRGLIWEAGWTVSDRHANLSDFEFAQESIGLVSWNIAKAYGFESRTTIRVGGPAHFVVFDNVPGTLKASVRAVVDGDIAECHTEQN
ncbi:hypothetical protein BASA50_003622 [Batrachochytrium salamandrivorans]|uniref:Amidohydrolase-related domain-containing protein n=1 Tax=Batrachochytrium salamandrivorans TaxID=1357716 RepID=A0ABQ8FJ73_9FUNG|nr:hypothetical protein BASA50_003622 [Batrachochytrium salamandrivorans]KAH6600761.1 hypothetical protein BASA61_002178 [Batrachochytrium salamandrivorans]KAH9266550.1 hypothetical protein BASA84_001036 [Batrachochytrium salamandrivorans]KAJ1334700.1 hypothetical protein BSLG_007855 [Batrachochytrium salamandrivorans]